MRTTRGISRKSRESFDERCYALLKRIPRGKVSTYQALAKALGTKAYRAVGQAMGRNQNAPKVPCHRVVRSDGTLGGYSGGLPKKVALLQKEGVHTKRGRVIDFESVYFDF